MVSAKQTKKALKDEHDTRLKRRLMGTAVLIALAVIFLPLVFDGSGTESQFTSIEPLVPEPAYDEQSLEEISMSELFKPTVIEFVDEPETNTDNNMQIDVPNNERKVPKQIFEPPAPNAIVSENKLPDNVTKPSLQKTRIQSVKDGSSDRLWLIQSASFNDKINALNLSSKLKNAGYPVLVKVGQVKGKAVFRVYVGPIQGKSDAMSIQNRVERTLKRKTLLIEE